MTTQQDDSKEEAATSAKSFLEQYPVEVLEAVLKILKAQRREP